MTETELELPPEADMNAAAVPRICEVTGCTPEDAYFTARIVQDDCGKYLFEIHPDNFADHARRCYRYLIVLRHMAKTPDNSAAILGWTRKEFDRHVGRYLGVTL
jgi:hypothetical protein